MPETDLPHLVVKPTTTGTEIRLLGSPIYLLLHEQSRQITDDAHSPLVTMEVGRALDGRAVLLDIDPVTNIVVGIEII